MESTQHLKNAPIREALIDIRVELPENLTAEVFSMLAKEHQGDFPSQGKARRFKAGFEFRDDGKAIAHAAHDASFEGVRLSNENGNEIVQFRTDGFTFNKLKPYTSWDDIYPETFEADSKEKRVQNGHDSQGEERCENEPEDNSNCHTLPHGSPSNPAWDQPAYGRDGSQENRPEASLCSLDHSQRGFKAVFSEFDGNDDQVEGLITTDSQSVGAQHMPGSSQTGHDLSDAVVGPV